jgi:predicted negative regulator of RcsB-dependent stress response
MADEQKKNDQLPATASSAPVDPEVLDKVNVRLGEDSGSDDSEAIPPEMRRLVNWLKSNATSIGLAAVVAVAVFAGTGYMRAAKEEKESVAARMLGQAQKAEDIQTAINTYPDTAAVPLGRIQLARTHFIDGRYQDALTAYNDFLAKHAGHPLLLNAQLERLQTMEAMGQSDEALQGVTQFIEKNPGHPLIPDATLTRARCLQNAGKFADAKVALEGLLASEANENWKSIARERLSLLERKLK